MKVKIIEKLLLFKKKLKHLKKEVSNLETQTVSRIGIREKADDVATYWVENLRSPLEHKFNIDAKVIKEMSQNMKRLHRLSRPSNLRTSYLETINDSIQGFDDRFILPIKQTSSQVDTAFDLLKILPGLPDPATSEYLKEAIDCANHGYARASIVLGWCCAIDRIQKKIISLGLNKFNDTSKKIKNRKKGKYKRWNKEFSLTTLAELQTVFDKDLIVIIEGMELIEGNQADRLYVCFDYRNQSAHPGEAPIAEPHIVSFFTDINSIILSNPKFLL